jgi:hypothetical protein
VSGVSGSINFIHDMNVRSLEQLKNVKRAIARQASRRRDMFSNEHEPRITDNLGLIINLLSCFSENDKDKLPPMVIMSEDVNILEGRHSASDSDFVRMSPIESARSLGALLAREYLVSGHGESAHDKHGVFSMAAQYNHVYEDALCTMIFASETQLALKHSGKVFSVVNPFLTHEFDRNIIEAKTLLERIKMSPDSAEDKVLLKNVLLTCLDKCPIPHLKAGNNLVVNMTAFTDTFRSLKRKISTEELKSKVASMLSCLKTESLSLIESSPRFEEVIESTWNCSACTCVNHASRLKCDVCETDRPKDGEGFDIKDDKGDNKWSCPACTFFNVASNSECEICQTVRPYSTFSTSPPTEPVKFSEWTCSACTLRNTLSSTSCTACGATAERTQEQKVYLNKSECRSVTDDIIQKVKAIAQEADISDLHIENEWERVSSDPAIVFVHGESISYDELFLQMVNTSDKSRQLSIVEVPTCCDVWYPQDRNDISQTLRRYLITYLPPRVRPAFSDTRLSESILKFAEEKDVLNIVSPLHEILQNFEAATTTHEVETDLEHRGELYLIKRNCDVLKKLSDHSLLSTSAGKKLVDRTATALQQVGKGSSTTISWWRRMLSANVTKIELDVIGMRLDDIRSELEEYIEKAQVEINTLQMIFDDLFSKSTFSVGENIDSALVISAVLQRIHFNASINLLELLGSTMSCDLSDVLFEKDLNLSLLLSFNDNLRNEEKLLKNVLLWSILNVNRIHAVTTLRTVKIMQSLTVDIIESLANDKKQTESSIFLFGMESDNLMNRLRQQRAHVEKTSLSVRVDPRYLYVEFALSSMLRNRQVELLKDFRANIDNCQSGVTQLIMGQVSLPFLDYLYKRERNV